MIPLLIHAEVYKWIDEKGNVHFTDQYLSIPEEFRQQIEKRSSSEVSTPAMGDRQEKEKFPNPIEKEKTEGTPVDIPSEPSSVGGTPEMPLIFSGKIISIDPGERTLTVEGKEGTIEFIVPESIRIATDFGNSVPFKELWRGMLVTVEYWKKGKIVYPLRIKINTAQLYRGR